jgi:hypothetical protein
MKTGRSLQDMAAELERQTASRKDYVAPQGAITAQVIPATDQIADNDDAPKPPQVVLAGLNGGTHGITPYAHRQFADQLGIPASYYDRMLAEQPDLLVRNLNTWLQAEASEKRMLRTLDGRVRAFVSPKYRPLDNYELATAILPKLIDLNVQIMSCELTETRMYIKGILPDLSDDLPAGVQWGSGHVAVAEYAGNRAGKVVASIVVSNSEVGAGSLRVEPSVFTTWCSNLAVIAQASMRKYHVGRSADVLEDFSIYRDETRKADDAAFWLKVADVTAAAFDRKIFAAAVDQIRLAAAEKIDGRADLSKVAEVTVQELKLPTRLTGGILTQLARGGDLSKWGVSSAITAVANTEGDYETATDLERAGGKVLALAARDWNRIATAGVAA